MALEGKAPQSSTYLKAAVLENTSQGKTEGTRGRVTLHSTANPPPPIATEKKTFLETLHSFPNQSLWKDMTVDGDGE